MTDTIAADVAAEVIATLVKAGGLCPCWNDATSLMASVEFGIPHDDAACACKCHTDTTGDGSFSIGSRVWPGLSKLAEEMGETIQVIGKLIATHGAADHWDGTNLRDRLEDEMADVGAALVFVAEANGLDIRRLTERTNDKLELFRLWHGEQA